MGNTSWNPVDQLHRSLDRFNLPFARNVDWQHRLKMSGLPEEIQELIFEVACRSRLLAFEKAEVTDELIAHFEDGNRLGKSFETLAGNFGDPLITAQLIRNSKIRNRPMFIKLSRIAAFGGAGALVAWVVAIILFNLGKPNPSVDYISKLNAPVVEVPPEDRAWDIYRDVWSKYQFCEAPGGRFEEIYFRSAGSDDDWRFIRPEDGGWDAAVQKLSDSRELLDAFRAGARLPSLGLPLQSNPNQYSREDRMALFPTNDPDEKIENSWEIDGMSECSNQLMSDSLLAILLPHVQSFRNIARILMVDTRWALQQGDTERATQNIESFFGLANQAGEANVLVCSLVSFAICTIGYDAIDDVLAVDPDAFSASQLARIQKAIELTSVRGLVNFDGERYMMKDVIQRIYTDDGKGDGRITPVGLEILDHLASMWFVNFGDQEPWLMDGILKSRIIGGPLSMMLIASRKEMTEKFDELMEDVDANFDTPMWENRSAIKDVEELLGSDSDKRKFRLLLELAPAYQQIRFAMERVKGNQNGMIIAIAAHRYRLKYGDWPETAEALIPEYIPEVPLDRANGLPLNYKTTVSGPLVYSVGMDLDDDGGTPVLLNEGGSISPDGHGTVPQSASSFTFANFPSDGDWVIWPRLSDN